MNKFGSFILTLVTVFLLAGCQGFIAGGGKGGRNIKSETREIYGFKSINAGNAVNLEITLQQDFSLTVEADAEMIDSVKTSVQGETLVINTKNVKPTPGAGINIKLSMWELKNLELWGASTVVVTGVKSDSLKIQAAGSSSLKLDGETKKLDASVIGASTIDAENLKTERTQARATGDSRLTVSVAGELTADAFGASRVVYLGDPQIVRQNTVGAGAIVKK
jgi:hypothetical protein